MILFAFLFANTDWFFTAGVLFAIFLWQCADFIKFSFKIKSDIDNIILSLESDDFSVRVAKTNYVPRFKESEEAMSCVVKLIQII